MPTYETPGVYSERDDARAAASAAAHGRRGVRRHRRARAGAARGRRSSRGKQFQACFGGMIAHGYLAYAVEAFFENGGRRCWVVRVEGRGRSDCRRRAAGRRSGEYAGVAREASSSGAWGNELSRAAHWSVGASRGGRRGAVDWVAVGSIAGIQRAGTVELIQESGGTMLARAARAFRRRCIAQPGSSGIAPTRRTAACRAMPRSRSSIQLRPFRIETVTYQLQVSSNGRPWRVYDDLSLVPEHPRTGRKSLNGVGGLFRASASAARARRARASAPRPSSSPSASAARRRRDRAGAPCRAAHGAARDRC